MSTLEAQTVDMTGLLLQAYALGDSINRSAEIESYLEAKREMERDAEAQSLIRAFGKAKERFADCERFGHFHPDYHGAMDEAKAAQERMERCGTIRRFKEAERRLDELLYDISKTIAHAVSQTVKVPSNELQPEGGCGAGGCSGGCASCG